MLEKKTISALKWILGIINSRNIPYQISGGLAAKIYGSKRPLNDIDIDIPEEDFDKIIESVSPYIIYGPAYYQDGKWDLLLMTLNFNGQEIDISGAFEVKVSNKDRTAWIPIPADLSDIVDMDIEEGLTVNVSSPSRVIAYKQHLDGEHQKEDIDSMIEYGDRIRMN